MQFALLWYPAGVCTKWQSRDKSDTVTWNARQLINHPGTMGLPMNAVACLVARGAIVSILSKRVHADEFSSEPQNSTRIHVYSIAIGFAYRPLQLMSLCKSHIGSSNLLTTSYVHEFRQWTHDSAIKCIGTHYVSGILSLNIYRYLKYLTRSKSAD